MENPTIEKLKKLLLSMREFFIPSMFHSFMGHVLLWFMKYILTGTYITVGINFMHGGAYNLAKLMSYDIPGQRYGKGDIYKLDKNIQRIFIDMFCGTGYLCYKMDNKSQRSKNYIRNLFKYFMYHIVNKIVLHLGGFWRVERGKLYSGGLETSMIGSFTMLFLFCLYVVYTYNKYPHVSPYIKKCVQIRLLAMIVYGDDHAWTWPALLQAILNTREFAAFLQEYFKMHLREVHESDTFLSEIDPVTYEVKKTGMTFLKRVFVKCDEPGLPPVIAHKETRQIMTSLCLKEFNIATGEEVDALDILLSCIGQAYDSQLNKIAYDSVKQMYELVIARHSLPNPEQQLRDYVNRSDKRLRVSKILRRIGMSDKDVLTSFPTWQNLMERSVLDMDKCAFGQRRNLDFIDYTTLEEQFDTMF